MRRRWLVERWGGSGVSFGLSRKVWEFFHSRSSLVLLHHLIHLLSPRYIAMSINLLDVLILTGALTLIAILAFLIANSAVIYLFQLEKPNIMSATSASDEFKVVERPNPKPAGT
jgi:hypothetical protein